VCELGELSSLSGRRIARICVLAAPVFLFIGAACHSAAPAFAEIAMWIAWAISVFGVLSVITHTRQLALRIPADSLATACRRLALAWFNLSVFRVVELVMETSSRSRALATTGSALGGVGLLILLIWSMLIGIRVRRALHKAAADARESWSMESGRLRI
jgi:hypothetical protein